MNANRGEAAEGPAPGGWLSELLRDRTGLRLSDSEDEREWDGE